jgi:endodeoxyribonuclease RusA
MHITLYFGTKRKADWDNFHKLSCDALSGIAQEDDSQIKQVTVALAYDKQSRGQKLPLGRYSQPCVPEAVIGTTGTAGAAFFTCSTVTIALLASLMRWRVPVNHSL